MAKKKATKREAIIVKEKIEPVKKVNKREPRIHFAKYAAKNSVSKNVVALMSVRNPSELRTEQEWKELIKREFSRTVI